MTIAVRRLRQHLHRERDDRRTNGDHERRAQLLGELPRAVRLGRPEVEANRVVTGLDALESCRVDLRVTRRCSRVDGVAATSC